VNALAYDAEMSILYLGGSFHSVGNVTITSGLAMWSKRTGLIDFPGGGVQHSDGGVSNTQVKAVAYEPKSEVCFNLLLPQFIVLKLCNSSSLCSLRTSSGQLLDSFTVLVSRFS
jgi:hypothetical protein